MCDLRKDLERYREVTGPIYGLDSTLSSVIGVTGCRINCRRTEYTTSLLWTAGLDELDKSGGYRTNSNFVGMISMDQMTTMKEEEVYTYDANNFIADAGGFMGLLLGLSFADLIPLVLRLWRKYCA